MGYTRKGPFPGPQYSDTELFEAFDAGIKAVSDAINGLNIFKVSSWGITGNGIADDSAELQAAENYRRSLNGVLEFDKGNSTLLITQQIDVGDRCAWRGIRSERGCHAAATDANYSTVTIKWRPADPNTYFIQEKRNTSSFVVFGPYEFTDLLFDFGNANGIQLGESGIDAGLGHGLMLTRPVHGIRFERCAVEAAAFTSSLNDGTMPRTFRRLFSLGNHYETTFEDVSFWGGDTHVYSSQGDMPEFSRCRSQYAVVPLDFRGASDSVTGTIRGFQIERWHLAAMMFDNTPMRVTDCRWENVVDNTNAHRITLPETCTVTAGSGTLVFSASMANKLYRGSLLELSDGTNTDTVLVIAVSGTSVTINTDGFAFDWSGTATAVRIHGHGIIGWGASNVNIHGGSPGAGPDTPAIVYVVGASQMALSQILAYTGQYGNIHALVVGNRLPDPPYNQSGLWVNQCSPIVCPDTANPFVHIDHMRSGHGIGYVQHERQRFGDLGEEENVIKRKWVFTPKSSSSGTFYTNRQIMKMLPGMTNTSERIAAWSVPASEYRWLMDRTLPSSGYMRITVKARARSIAGTLGVRSQKLNISETALFSRTLTTAWQVFDAWVPVPTADFNTGRTLTTDVGIVVDSDQAFFLAGVVVEELIGPFHAFGTGSPEGVVSAPVGSTYSREDGGAGTSWYVKQSGTGNTGWVGK